MTKIGAKTSIEELAAIVSQALIDAGVDAVLSGGAAVSIYTRNEYESADLDFISMARRNEIDSVMTALGFKRVGRVYTHPQTPLFVEFPAGPLAIGDLLISLDETATKRTKRGNIRLLTPTQCAMDRLAAYFHWNDLQSLDQAVMVAKRQKISLSAIKSWAEREGMSDRFEVFAARLKEAR